MTRENNRGDDKKKSTQPDKSEELSKQFDDALTNFLKNQAKTKNKSLKNYKSLENLLNQYLNSFILIGYTQDTRQFISLVNAKNEQHADSLSTALNKFIVKNAQIKNIPPDIY